MESDTSDSPTSPSQSAVQTPVVGWILCALLIGNFLWRAFTDGHEYPMRSAQLLEIGIDALMIVGLFGVKSKLPVPLFWIALVAGIGLFVIRLHSDASWWTGHWNYSLLPRR
jgi:hypothetical protein